ncbi:hypothetical protein [Lentzea aerocolonigenes]|uniref:hypothetical protein n=1 Tax=Lentzea aerocolonigenes TaxID=68170 RepID=UPI0004C2FF1F|nr:hypothetical protein [Lentzea aerocolonigenes]MCP2244724.1 hypothetical protein [Lentzea aerocolonigenes]
MKRSIVLVAIAAAFGLTACTSTPTPEQNAAPVTQPPSTTAPSTSVVTEVVTTTVTNPPAPQAVVNVDSRLGYGALKLGMTLEEARGTGETNLTWQGADDGPCLSDSKITISKQRGVVAITLPVEAKTSKGIGVGSTFADVKNLYPGAHEYRGGWTAAVDANSYYVFFSITRSEDYHELTETISGIKLVANGADCGPLWI